MLQNPVPKAFQGVSPPSSLMAQDSEINLN